MSITRRWVERGALAVGGCAILAVVATVNGTHVDLVALAVILLAGCAIYWCAKDSVAAASETSWIDPPEPELRYVRTDPAAAHLKRVCAEVVKTGTHRGSPAAAQSLQTAVRQLVAQRVEQRPMRGLPALEGLPTDLAAYLQTTPAPRLHPKQLDHIVTSIEGL